MPTNEELETRLAALEQRIGAAPLAANPPVTIGELSDVPAPGSPIASQWAQETTNRIVHRFATLAALQAWAAADGSLAFVSAAPGSHYYRQGGSWWPFTQLPPEIANIKLTPGALAINTTPAFLASTIAFGSRPVQRMCQGSVTVTGNTALVGIYLYLEVLNAVFGGSKRILLMANGGNIAGTLSSNFVLPAASTSALMRVGFSTASGSGTVTTLDDITLSYLAATTWPAVPAYGGVAP